MEPGKPGSDRSLGVGRRSRDRQDPRRCPRPPAPQRRAGAHPAAPGVYSPPPRRPGGPVIQRIALEREKRRYRCWFGGGKQKNEEEPGPLLERGRPLLFRCIRV